MACCGEEYSILLDSEGRCWGSGSLRGLGPIDIEALAESDCDYISDFARLRLANIEFVTSGKDHCLAFSNHVSDRNGDSDSANSKHGLHSGARVYGWGCNDKYQLTQRPDEPIQHGNFEDRNLIYYGDEPIWQNQDYHASRSQFSGSKRSGANNFLISERKSSISGKKSAISRTEFTPRSPMHDDKCDDDVELIYAACGERHSVFIALRDMPRNQMNYPSLPTPALEYEDESPPVIDSEVFTMGYMGNNSENYQLVSRDRKKYLDLKSRRAWTDIFYENIVRSPQKIEFPTESLWIDPTDFLQFDWEPTKDPEKMVDLKHVATPNSEHQNLTIIKLQVS